MRAAPEQGEPAQLPPSSTDQSHGTITSNNAMNCSVSALYFHLPGLVPVLGNVFQNLWAVKPGLRNNPSDEGCQTFS